MSLFFPSLHVSTSLVPTLFHQLRVIRAFKSMLEDLEDKRSIHSHQSLHSMRHSRSHHGQKSVLTRDDSYARFLQTTSSSGLLQPVPTPSSGCVQSEICRVSKRSCPPLSSMNVRPNLQHKSKSCESVPLVGKEHRFNSVTTIRCKSKTLSQSDIHNNIETPI